jgi:hypothetical protein
MLVLFLVLKAL